MSAMAMASRGERSRLNPNAPLFIPAAFQRVEDFSPEWWELVKTTGWFRDHWFRQHQEQENFDGEDEDDVANLLPDSFDLGIVDEFSSLEEADLVDMSAAYDNHLLGVEGSCSSPSKQAPASDAEYIMKSLSMKSPRNGTTRPVLEPTKYWEKPVQSMSPKCSPRHVIHKPR